MRKGEQTRQQIIRKAAPIFNQRGYSGAALSDLMRATGLKKGGIYRHFESKQELVRTIEHWIGGTQTPGMAMLASTAQGRSRIRLIA